MLGRKQIRVLGLVGVVSGVVLLGVVSRLYFSAPRIPTFAEVDSAYCELVDIRGRAQMESRRHPDTSYLSEEAFTNVYSDKRLGEPMRNRYTILADFSDGKDVSNPVPPLLSLPRELMAEFPDQKYPVFLMRPQDNNFEHVMHLVRVAFLTSRDIDLMVSGSAFSMEVLEERCSLQDRVDHPVWKLYSQNLLFKYFGVHEIR